MKDDTEYNGTGRMTAPTPNAPAGELQPKVALREAEEVARRERLPTVLRAYAVQFDEYFVSDSDAGNSARRAADEIVSLRAALLAARREVEARAALHNRVVSLLLAIKHDAEWQDHCVRSQFTAYHAEASALIAELNPRVAARESEVVAAVTAAALAATPEEKNATP